MGKMLVFAILVIIGTAGILAIANNKSNGPIIPDITLIPTRTPSVTEQPSPTMNTSTTSASPSPSNQNLERASKAVVKTSKGDIELILYPDSAPITVDNLVKKSKNGFYNNLTFHRVEDWVIQGGDPLGNGTGGGQLPTELNDRPFVQGSLGVARGGDINISNDAQFFITKTPADWLNKQYTNFGTVTKGLDVVQKIVKDDKILGITVE